VAISSGCGSHYLLRQYYTFHCKFHCISGRRVSGRSMIDDRSDFLEERMEMYDEWIYTAKVRHVHTFRYGDN
jgi:hypothetical protein